MLEQLVREVESDPVVVRASARVGEATRAAAAQRCEEERRRLESKFFDELRKEVAGIVRAAAGRAPGASVRPAAAAATERKRKSRKRKSEQQEQRNLLRKPGKRGRGGYSWRLWKASRKQPPKPPPESRSVRTKRVLNRLATEAGAPARVR